MKKLLRILKFIVFIAALFFISMEVYYKTINTNKLHSGDSFKGIQNESTITIVGNIEYKQIFRQNRYDAEHLKSCLPFQKKSKTDSSVFLSYTGNRVRNITKFTIDYDSCTVSTFDDWFVKSWKYKDIPYKYKNYIVRQDSAALEQWKLEIEKINENCDDTDSTRVKLFKDEANYIEFTHLDNVIIEELDLDKDGLSEVYILSYFWCQCEMDVYRVNIK